MQIQQRQRNQIKPDKENRVSESQNNKIKSKVNRLLQFNSEHENYQVFNLMEQSILVSIAQQLEKGYQMSFAQADFINGLWKKKKSQGIETQRSGSKPISLREL